MFTGIVIGLLSAAALVQQTDTLVDANGANRLELESLRGEVVIRTWDRQAVQVKASHSDSRTVEVHRSGRTLSVDVEVDRGLGLAGTVDFQITVPRAFDLDLEGMALDVDIQGSAGQVRVTTVHGSIRVQGGRGTIVLGTVEGEIEVEGAEGRLEVNGVAGPVTIRNCSGDIYAQSVAGSITMEGITSKDVEAGTVGGELRYTGSIEDNGVYNFGSHGGSLWLYLPTGMNARVEAVTLAGDIEVDYPGAQAEPSRGRGFPGLNEKEVTFETGTASATVDVETFGGTIHILRRGG